MSESVNPFKPSRLLLVILFGFIIALSIDSLIQYDSKEHNRFYDFILSIVLTFIIWNGNVYIDLILNNRLPWTKKPAKRALVHFASSTVFSVLTIYTGMVVYNNFVCNLPDEVRQTLHITSVLIGTLFSIILVSIEIGFYFFRNWKSSLQEAERYKAESYRSQLENLKNQINPHFLFNNLSVLNSLVYKDADKASEFINQLSKVYRYLLDKKNFDLVPVTDELVFIQSYLFLLKIRFGNAFVCEIKVNESDKKLLIPPMVLQILVENSIQHNEVSQDNPLHLSIRSEQFSLIVSNNLQLRKNPEKSTKTGLQNIKKRYAHFTNSEVLVSADTGYFKVILPLINETV